MTVAPHPFDVPLDQPIELAPITVDDHGPADAHGAEQQADDHEQEGPGDQLNPADGAADQVDDDHQASDDVEHDGDHGETVPALRPFDPVQLKRALSSWVDGLASFEDQAVGLAQVEDATAALGEAKGELVDRLVEGMPLKPSGRPVPWVETPVGILKGDSTGGYSSWDAEMVWVEALAEARRRAADPETGELTAEADRGAQAMLGVVKELLTSPAFRVGALKNLGLDPDEYRATSPKRRIVRFV